MRGMFFSSNHEMQSSGEHDQSAGLVSESASGRAVHVVDPLGQDAIRKLVTPPVMTAASEARRRANVV